MRTPADLEKLAATAKWQGHLVRKMSVTHIISTLMMLHKYDKNDTHNGLTYGEWLELFQYENHKRGAKSPPPPPLKTTPPLTGFIGDGDEMLVTSMLLAQSINP